MARISGIDLPEQGKVDWALTRVKGIGWSRSREIMEATGISVTKRVKDLTTEEVAAISSFIDKYNTEGDLVRQIRENIQRLKDINSYVGLRHSRGLPVRGQRTRSNARTKRGKRKTVGSFRKEAIATKSVAGAGAKE